VISNQNGLVEPTIAEPTENATSLADMISPQSGIAYPTASGIAYPTASGIAYPTASGIAYPTASGIAYPTASGIATLISSEL
jgi:hypothetical protein